MDILQQKYKFDDKLLYIIKELKFKNNRIEIKGTASLASQQYFSDYDLFSNIKGKYTNDQIYREVVKIINKIEKDDQLYFIELKVQNVNGSKTKFRQLPIPKDKFIKSITELNFIKIDMIARIENKFIEVSIIYSFSPAVESKADYVASLKDDIVELDKEHNYYKILKRLFSLYKIHNKKPKLVELTKFFNSDIGALYQKNSNLKAIKLLLEKYQDQDTIKKVIFNLEEIKESPDYKIISKSIKANDKIINSKAKTILKSHNL